MFALTGSKYTFRINSPTCGGLCCLIRDKSENKVGAYLVIVREF